MDSSEEEELALLGFALIMNDDGNKEEKKRGRFWVRDIYKKKRRTRSFFKSSP